MHFMVSFTCCKLAAIGIFAPKGTHVKKIDLFYIDGWWNGTKRLTLPLGILCY